MLLCYKPYINRDEANTRTLKQALMMPAKGMSCVSGFVLSVGKLVRGNEGFRSIDDPWGRGEKWMNISL